MASNGGWCRDEENVADGSVVVYEAHTVHVQKFSTFKYYEHVNDLNVGRGHGAVHGEAIAANELTERIVERILALHPDIVAATNVVRETFEADVELTVPTRDGPRDVVVEISWGTQGGLARRYRHMRSRVGGPVVLGLPYVDTRTARRLRAEGIPFIDASGNAWIDLPGFYVEVDGRRPVMEGPDRRRAGIGELSVAGLRVCVRRPYRSELAPSAGAKGCASGSGIDGHGQTALVSMAESGLIVRGRPDG